MREKLDFGRVFNAIFELYKAHVGPLLVPAAIIFLGAALLTGLLFVISPILVIFSFVIVIIAQFWYQGMVIELVNRVHAGTGVPPLGELFSAVGPKLGRLIAAGFVAGIAIAIGLVLLVVPGLFLLTIWAVIAPVIVIEGKRAMEALGRSQQLVKGDGWVVFGVIAVIFIINAFVSFIIRGIVGSDTFVGGLLGSFIPNLIFAPIGALAATVIYFELRRLKEGVQPAGAPAGVPGAAAQAGVPGAAAPGVEQPGAPTGGVQSPPGPPPATEDAPRSQPPPP